MIRSRCVQGTGEAMELQREPESLRIGVKRAQGEVEPRSLQAKEGGGGGGKEGDKGIGEDEEGKGGGGRGEGSRGGEREGKYLIPAPIKRENAFTGIRMYLQPHQTLTLEQMEVCFSNCQVEEGVLDVL